MDMTEVFSGDYLKAADLKGKSCTLKIAGVEVVDFDDGRKPILSFHGTDKKMVMNKTNTNTAIDIFGSDSDDWIGKSLTIIPAQTDFQGKQVPCIRVALPEFQMKTSDKHQQSSEVGVDEIPF